LQVTCISSLQVFVPGYPVFLIKNPVFIFLNVLYVLTTNTYFSLFCAIDCIFHPSKYLRPMIGFLVIVICIYQRVLISFGAFPSDDEVCIPLFYDCMPRIYMLKSLLLTTIIFCLKFWNSVIFHPDCFMIIRGLIERNVHN
jgi:hypothetical protein